jgi:predicted nucleic acid-binding protein
MRSRKSAAEGIVGCQGDREHDRACRIVVRCVRQPQVVVKLKEDFSLGKGEAAAIALALGRKQAIVETDDRRAINACRLLKVPFTTALAVLVRMRENVLLSAE